MILTECYTPLRIIVCDVIDIGGVVAIEYGLPGGRSIHV